MSPEQVKARDLDARTDLFSFGAVLYEMATGKMPFEGASSGELCGAILRDQPVPPSQLNSHVSSGLDTVILCALEKDGDPRYQHASDMRAELLRLKRDTDSALLPINRCCKRSACSDRCGPSLRGGTGYYVKRVL